MERNNFIGGKSTRKFLVSSLIATLSLQLPIMVVPFIAGQLLSPDSVAAINLTTPIKEFWYAIVLLFAMGANLLSGYCIGHNDTKAASGHFTMAVFSCITVILALFAVIFPLRHAVTDFLCGDNPQIWQLTYDYLSISLFDCLPMAIFTSLGMFISMDGHPEKVARISVIVSIVEIVLAFGFVQFTPSGIQGLAWAIIVGDVIGTTLTIPYFVSDDNSLTIRFVKGKMWGYLGANLKKGTPQMLDNLIYTLSIMLINAVVLRAAHGDGVVAWSIMLTMTTIGDFFYCAISQTEMSLGEIYMGESDITGLEFLTRNARRYLLLSLVVLFAVIEISPAFIVQLFGVTDPASIAGCSVPMRLAAFLLFYHFVVLVAGDFCLLERDGQYVFFLIAANVIPLVMVTLIAILLPEHLWWSFVLCGLAYALLFLWINKKVETTMKDKQNAVTYFETSMPYDMTLISTELDKLQQFLADQHVPADTFNRIEHCMDELSYNIIKHRPKNLDSKTFDIRVVMTESGIDLICKDAGRPFNPVIDFDTDAATAVQKGEKAMLSLRVFNYYASNPEYKRLHCVNFTRLSFPIGEE